MHSTGLAPISGVQTAIISLSLLLLAGCVNVSTRFPSETPENFQQLSTRVFSSGEPVGKQAFKAIRDRGITTIVSVDGARPDVAAARRQGLRYVHLPIGYDGIPPSALAALNQLLHQQTGPILVHCHHGKHRGPAAAAVACMMEGSMNHEQALVVLKRSGTSPDYAGLWRDVREFKGVLATVQPAPLTERSEIDPLAQAMVSVDSSFEKLASAVQNTPVRWHVATEQAVLLVEGFREACRSSDNGTALRQRMTASQEQADALLQFVRSKELFQLRIVSDQLKAECRACHNAHRN